MVLYCDIGWQLEVAAPGEDCLLHKWGLESLKVKSTNLFVNFKLDLFENGQKINRYFSATKAIWGQWLWQMFGWFGLRIWTSSSTSRSLTSRLARCKRHSFSLEMNQLFQVRLRESKFGMALVIESSELSGGYILGFRWARIYFYFLKKDPQHKSLSG